MFRTETSEKVRRAARRGNGFTVPRSISFFSPLIRELRHGRRCIAFDLSLEVVGGDVRHAHGGLSPSLDNPASVPSPPAPRSPPHPATGQKAPLQIKSRRL